MRGIGGAHRLWASAPPIRRETLFHNNLAAADDVDACGQPVACVIEAIGHAAALQVIHRTVLSVGRLVRHVADAGGLAVDDDGELLGARAFRTSDIGAISGNRGAGGLRRYLVEEAVVLQDVGVSG